MTSLRYRTLLLGGTGTIGRATAQALLEAGHGVTALVRPGTDPALLPGCTLVEGDVTAPDTVENLLKAQPHAAIVSCLASRTGAPEDAWEIDHRAHSLALEAALETRVQRFVLLSAICVQKPHLAFQKAKIAFESQLRASPLIWSIVRPTAFFKSLSGQVPRVQAGKPFLVFGDGTRTACKPISDADLGRFIASCLTDADKERKILPIGGPGPAITPLDQAAMLERLTGQPVKIKHVPFALMDVIVGVLGALGKVAPKFKAKAELAKIGRYYATESMLLWNPQTGCYDPEATPEYGTDRLEDHYAAMLRGEVGDDRGAHAIF
ncbi:divinylchlorophyllide 8-vinylreductase [Rhodobacter aestuarii]|uniref:Divinyl chlorophyllide a 8-vinyl-reductase, chloroplastic n=1 Tax=Rhodobacter aestuarii TaxID=453582 RepID=A0A1N7QCY8_9RHOB|nr:NAD(P)H-binding protein [Rhodobacter aestuarii]PTV93563.1 divinylchlorophyllide 8-vinylreductase [Rhodobacter aestuarii]SIT20708.1 divinylchlorophyllide 8-vinylreductase [Rhodobacter aestuarii]